MMKEFSPQEPLDPRLISMLNLLRDTPERDPDIVAQNKSQFLSELAYLPLPSEQPSAVKQFLVGLGLLPEYQQNKENNKMKSHTLRLAVTILAILVLVVIVLFGGSTATVLAAQNSIPGDTLYPIKTTMERTRLSLTRSTEGRIELQMEFAEQRLDEIKSLILDGRFQNIKPATMAFEAHIMNALNELNALAEQDPVLAASLMARITDSLSRYAAALSDMAGRVPDLIRADMENTIINIGGGDNTNDNDNFNMNSNDSFDDNSNDSYDDDDDDSYNENYNDAYDDDNYNDSYDDDDDYNDNYNDSYDDDDDGYNDN
ncbi:MAG: DUF5667 domain-containing protein, partial [Brevefilum sp.]|nr:DUF5667 domain-containing protein [Brevefilum sp.]